MYSYAGFHCWPILQILCSAELVLHPRIRLGCAQQPAVGWRSTVRLAPAIFYSRTSTGCPCQTVLCPCRRCACVAGAHGLGFVPIDSSQRMAFDSASSTRRLSSSFSLSARPRVVLRIKKTTIRLVLFIFVFLAIYVDVPLFCQVSAFAMHRF